MIRLGVNGGYRGLIRPRMAYWYLANDVVHFVSVGISVEAIVWEEVLLHVIEPWLESSWWGITTEYCHQAGFLVILMMSMVVF